MANIVKNMVVLGVGALGVVYLLNPTAGFLEFLPDNLPLIGNLDEGIAVTLVLGAARYYGVDIGNIFKRNDEPPALPADDTEKRKRLPPN